MVDPVRPNIMIGNDMADRHNYAIDRLELHRLLTIATDGAKDAGPTG